MRISAALRGSKNLTIRADTLVDHVVLEKGRAAGVRLASSYEIIGADLVILAAGTYASPALLMRSGIGPAPDLAGLGVECHVDLPGVGRNLADHSWVLTRLPVTIAADGPGFQTVLTWHSAEANALGPPDLQIFA